MLTDTVNESRNINRLFCQFDGKLDSSSRCELNEFVVSIICQSGPSADAVAQEITVSVVDTSQSPDEFDIHGSASSGPRNFAYKVN